MDFYVLLGVRREATLNDIKRAYKRLARRLHPDINPGDGLAAAQFRQILEAYETLSDPERRRRYDTHGRAGGSDDQTVSLGFDGFDFSVTVSGPSAPTFGDLFGDVLRQRERQRADEAHRGADLHHTVTLTFDESVRGGRRDLTITRRAHCPSCQGAGRIATAESDCLACEGSGAVRSIRGHMVFSKTCPRCRGTGRRGDTMCPTCGGQRTEARTEVVRIGIPPGVADGSRLRIAGKGHAGRNGGEYGDLLVAVHVEPHPLFRREGDDLHLVLPLAIHEAALGAKIDVPSIDGTARLRVPPGTQSGQRFRLRARGAPSPRGGRGDLVVEVRLMLPSALDERSKELLREFGNINAGDDVRASVPGGEQAANGQHARRYTS